MPTQPIPPGSNSAEQERIYSLIRSIGNDGEPKRDQAIVKLRAFLTSGDSQVRVEAGAMLYRMKDRSGYATLLELLRSPVPVPGTRENDLRNRVAREFARYRERQAGEVLLSQYEKTRSTELWQPVLTLRLEGMVPYLHESLKQRMSPSAIAGLAALEPEDNQTLFQRTAADTNAHPRYRAAAIFGLAKGGDAAALERLIAVATNAREALPGNHDDLWRAQQSAATYLTDFRGERVVKVFEEMLTWKDKTVVPSIALVYLRYRYPENKPSREIIKAGLQPGGARLGWSYTTLLQLARLSGDPELIALGKQTDRITAFRELDVRAGWSNAWIGHYLPDWEGDMYE